MSYCPNCGNELEANSYFCAQCGADLRQTYQPNPSRPLKEDVPNTGLKVLSFFFPVVGLILFCVMQREQPICAKAYGKMALIGFIIGAVLSVLYAIGMALIFTFSTGAAFI